MSGAVHYLSSLAGLVVCARAMFFDQSASAGPSYGPWARCSQRFDVSRSGRRFAGKLRLDGLATPPSRWIAQQLLVFLLVAGILVVLGAGLMAPGLGFTATRLVGGMRRRRCRRNRQTVEVAVSLGRRIQAELALQRSLEESICLARSGNGHGLADSILEYAAGLVGLGDRGGNALRAAAERYAVDDDPAMVVVLAALEHPGARTEWIMKVLRTVAEDSEQRNKVVSSLMEARVVAVALPILTLVFAATLVSIDPAISAVLGSGMAVLLCAGCAVVATLGTSLVTRVTTV